VENKHKIQDKKNANRPTLRRASADTTKGDQPPVLKRRDDNNQGSSPN